RQSRTGATRFAPRAEQKPLRRNARRQPAAATARAAMTGMRCARYSADAWRSPISPVVLTVTDFADPAGHLVPSAPSSSFMRNTHAAPPVTATRTPPEVCATNTPTNAKRDAGLGNFTYPAFLGTGNETETMISPC